MSDFKIGVRVEIKDKALLGTIAYIGHTNFAPGEWIGIILDEPKGKNNGFLKGRCYFTCEENYGMFVRPVQVQLVGSSMDLTTSNARKISRSSAYTPQPTKAHLTSSRASLSTSRQSFLGLRSQVAGSISSSITNIPRRSLGMVPQQLAQTSDSRNVGAETGGATSKASSFIETGFLEILTPQYSESQPKQSFTAMPSQCSSSSSEDKVGLADAQRIITDLKEKVSDLSEKLETLKQRRSEDKERLRNFDKLKIENDQLQEFRSKIMASHSVLQRELQRSKQEAKDAIEAKERHAQEMAELADNIEMITLDKEMAEEKSDTLQLELESAKERIEELQVDLDLIRAEMQNYMDGNSSNLTVDVNTNYQLKQLQQQNLRLKETLVRLRDIIAHDKHEIQKLNKELEMKRSEVSELEHTKEKLSIKVDDLESNISELQEQVDAALGAEEMVEQLAGKKIELEDKLKALEEEITQLEALEEVHEQLVESNHELELDLREELDLANNAKRQALRERDAAIETIYDRDQTINKFRDLVHKLNEELMELREKSTNSEEKHIGDTSLNVAGEAAVDYKQMFAESKAHIRAIDVQLKQIELQQSNDHVSMLIAFMPESFTCRGGDHDSILVILLISRLISKCDIIISQTRERSSTFNFLSPQVSTHDSAALQYAFKCRLLYYIFNMQCALHQLCYGLKRCHPDTLTRAGSSLPEMIAKEKTVDAIIDLLKSNQLDENSSTDQIEKSALFFTKMNEVLLASEELLNERQILQNAIVALHFACESIFTESVIAKSIIQETETDCINNSALFLQFIIENIEELKKHIKLTKRRLPADTYVIKLGISLDKFKLLLKHVKSISRLISVINITVKKAMQTIASSFERNSTPDYTLGHNTFWGLLLKTCEIIYEQDDRGPMQNFRPMLVEQFKILQEIAQFLLEKENDIILNANKRKDTEVSSIALRAHFIKKQLEQKSVLAATLENREADIKQLKLASKMKQNELSEMQIRKDVAEKKLSVLQIEYKRTKEKLERQYEEALKQLEQKGKEFEETMDHLQSDIEQLQNEKSDLRDRLKLTMPNKNIPTENTSLELRTNLSLTTLNAHCGSMITADEAQIYKMIFCRERNARLQLQAKEIRQTLKKFNPIYVPRAKDKRISHLENEITKMRNVLTLSYLIPKSEPISAVQCLSPKQRICANTTKADVNRRVSQLASEILNEYLHRKPYLATEYSDFALFSTPQY